MGEAEDMNLLEDFFFAPRESFAAADTLNTTMEGRFAPMLFRSQVLGLGSHLNQQGLKKRCWKRDTSDSHFEFACMITDMRHFRRFELKLKKENWTQTHRYCAKSWRKSRAWWQLIVLSVYSVSVVWFIFPDEDWRRKSMLPTYKPWFDP